jgi:O-antigen ligase
MKATNIFNYLLIVIAMFPLLGMKITIIFIILWCIFSSFIGIREKLYLNFFKDRKSFIFLIGYYLMAIISFLFVSENMYEASKDLETKASFLIFPIFFYLCRTKLNKKLLKNTLLSFSISNIFLALYIWTLIFNKGIFDLFENDTYYHPLFREIFKSNTDIHLPYLGLLFGFSIIILVNFLITKNRVNKIKALLVFGVFVLLLSMFIFSARMAILSTFISFLFYSFYKVKSNRKKIIFLLIAIFIGVSLGLLPPIKRRIIGFSNTELKLPDSTQKSHEVNFRYGIYYCAKNVIKENWLMGVGLGSVQDKLDHCYDNFNYRGYDDFKNRQYNTHNQYLNAWISYGVFGLLFLFFYLGYSFYKGDLLQKSFILLFSIALLTESLFEREIGVMVFSFFNNFFFVQKYSEQNLKKSHKI